LPVSSLFTAFESGTNQLNGSETIPLEVSLYLLNSTIADVTQRPIVQGLLRFSNSILRVSAEKHSYALAGKMVLDVDLPTEIQADRQLTHWEGTELDITLTIPVTVNINGDFLVSATAINRETDFTSTTRLVIRVAETQEQLQQSLAFKEKPIVPTTVADILPRAAAGAPPDYAHVYGIAYTYQYADGRSYMLRGNRMELWDSLLGVPTTKLKTVYTVEPSTDSDYGLTPNNYVSGGTWYHVDQSGYFDFGNIYVGWLGKDLIIRMAFIFHDSGDGASESGTEKLQVLDASNSNIVFSKDYGPVHCSSGQECGLLGIQAPSLGGPGGEDEAAHVFYDITKTYSYLKRLVVFTPWSTTTYLRLSDTSAPFTDNTGKIYYNGWNTGYLTYEKTDSIIHEYAHAVHWQMRSGSFPPYAPGDTNHGGCANPTSADGLVEGWARYLPTVANKDPLYHWGPTTSTWDISSNSGINAECDRSEWTFGAILWNIRGDIGGGSHDWFSRTAQTLNIHDPNLVRGYYDSFISDWGYHDQVWQVFANHNVIYEVITVTETKTITKTETSTSYSYRTTTTTSTSYTSTSTSTSTITTATTVVLVPLTVTSTVQSTQYLTSILTTTLTSYTSTTTSTSTIPTTVALVPLTMTSTVQSTELLTSILTTTVTSYTGTQTSTSTIVVPTTVVLVPTTVTSTVQSTQYLTSILTTTVTSYTGTQTLTSTIPTVTTVVLLPSTVTSTMQGTQYLTSILTTTVTSYTATTTSTSTWVVYRTVTASPGGAGAGASGPLGYVGFLSLVAVAVGRRVKGWRIPKVRSALERSFRKQQTHSEKTLVR
jgi:hypothetical protein